MPVPVPVIGAGISALGGMVSTLFGNRGRKRSQERAFKNNIRLWNMEKEYNHPSAQMARLRKAGLNPNLIYGTSPTSAVGNAGTPAPDKAAPYEFKNPFADMVMYADIKQKEAQTSNLKTQNDVLIQEAALKAAQTANTMIGAAGTKVDYEVAKELQQTSVDFQKENLRKLELESIGQQLDNTFKDRAMSDRLKDVMYRAHHARETMTGQQLENALKRLDLELKRIGIEKSDPWYFRIMGRNPKKGAQLHSAIQQGFNNFKSKFKN